MEPGRLRDAVIGCLLGTAVGDAVGLPAEGLSPRRQTHLFGGAITGPRLVFGRGMISDDTEHACIVAQALIASGGEPERFTRSLANGLREWLLLFPAGAGRATLQAAGRLLVGVPPSRSGVYSAGNGPAMRAALLGVFCDDDAQIHALVRASTRITHTDPKAEYGARAVAIAARIAAQQQLTGDALLPALRDSLCPEQSNDADELLRLLQDALGSVARGEETMHFAASLGLGERGVSGYIYHTVPVALHAVLRYPNDLRATVLACVACGGDTDTTAAIAGGIVGANVGRAGIPSDWVGALWELPRDVAYLERLGLRLATVLQTGRPDRPLPLNHAGLALRNLAFLTVVLSHGMRRLLPPY